MKLLLLPCRTIIRIITIFFYTWQEEQFLFVFFDLVGRYKKNSTLPTKVGPSSSKKKPDTLYSSYSQYRVEKQNYSSQQFKKKLLFLPGMRWLRFSRLLKMIGLFCRILSLLQGSFAKETYHFKVPTNCSHPIPVEPSSS